MYLAYANLVHFATGFTYGSLSEANLEKSVLAWVGQAQEQIDADYYFTVTYSYNQFGLAVDASIMVQHKVNGVWLNLGTYSPFGVSLTSVIATTTCIEDAACVPSDIPSVQLSYWYNHYSYPNYVQSQ